MKTKEQVAEEIKKLLTDNDMMMVSVTRFEQYVQEPSHDVHLVLQKDRFNHSNRDSVLINRE